MIITQVNKFESQVIANHGEMVPITDEGFEYIWEQLGHYFAVHVALHECCGHTYHIEVNGEYLPSTVKNAIEFQEWYECLIN